MSLRFVPIFENKKRDNQSLHPNIQYVIVQAFC